MFEKVYHEWFRNFNSNVHRCLTPECLAIWYMDDGSLSRKIRDNVIHGYELSISTYCSELEADTLVNYFLNIWNIRFSKRINKDRYTIRCGTKEARKFIDIIRPYMSNDMLYKIDIGSGSFTESCLI